MPSGQFAHHPQTAAEHFRLSFFATIARLFEQLEPACGTSDVVVERFPFLGGYRDEMEPVSKRGVVTSEQWDDALRQWESAVVDHLPLRALRNTGPLNRLSEALWLTVGLSDEDPRFGLVFEDIQGVTGQRRPTLGLLTSWYGEAARAELFRLIGLGLLEVVNTDAPRLEWAVHVCAPIWDAVRGESWSPGLPGTNLKPVETLLPLERLIISEELRGRAALLPRLMADGEIGALVVRGPQHNGRRTLLGALARELGLGVLEVFGLTRPDDPRWKILGPLGVALRAMPVIVLDLAPGESVELPWNQSAGVPLGIVLGKHGGLGGTGFDRSLTVTLELPHRESRLLHWHAVLGGEPAEHDRLAAGFRLSGGTIRKSARLAKAQAALDGRSAVTPHDVRAASRTLNRQALDALATRLETAGDWSDLAVDNDVRRDLDELRGRCRHRETLAKHVGAGLGCRVGFGVRALLTGPSGTGKTLAARLLAAELGCDLYRLELSALMSKYLGESEKNMHRALTLAEELDVMLLLDEGDALLAPRTGVENSNDRYANLETNFLLQRLETFDGVLLITTNAFERIDSAFVRRMDAIVEFRPPEPPERLAIWTSHLPSEHQVDDRFLREVAARCVLTGGQIRNAVLHTVLLALDAGRPADSALLESAVQREYRKAGGVCPLRQRTNGNATRE